VLRLPQILKLGVTMADVSFPPAVEEFLRDTNFLVLATIRRDGSPQVTPVWYLWEDGHFMINATNGRAKVANMRRNPHVAFVIQDLKLPYRYIQVQGRVTFIEGGELGHYDIDRLSERYTGNPRFQGDPNHETDRITFHIEPESFTSMGF
jgi:PPOX class probable F420-dependent enzyme